MNKRLLLRIPSDMFCFVLTFILILSSGCSLKTRDQEPVASPVVDGNKALEQVSDFIEISPRHSGSKGAELAAEYIFTKLAELGFEAEIDEFSDATPIGELTFRNVTGVKKGLGKTWIILGSHYDGKSGMPESFTGANDSGSSTGLLIELAKVLKDYPALHQNLLFAFFDGEECINKYGPKDGLHGSKRMVKVLQENGILEETEAVIVIDMIGDSDLNVTMPPNSTSALIAEIFKAAHQVDKRSFFSLNKMPILDDHRPFYEAGIPTVLLIDFKYGSAPDRNDYWHTGEDTIDKLSAESLETVGNVVLQTLVNLSEKAKGLQ